ncbi:hypothetical protein MAPG_09126 [Magnaporthiopsis poae ATCC 64411]|uniref:Uncharacterized protein n=1 Tax=Magnaporthiopsis poae (strain ATCC 64411 / 73-15) TaxID=644358 RepID=A0A0C4E948_MAGP6|nr:hypothetical protein MAPG_09126 [Magnaporthiopsis poae ATCC 64411]
MKAVEVPVKSHPSMPKPSKKQTPLLLQPSQDADSSEPSSRTTRLPRFTLPRCQRGRRSMRRALGQLGTGEQWIRAAWAVRGNGNSKIPQSPFPEAMYLLFVCGRGSLDASDVEPALHHEPFDHEPSTAFNPAGSPTVENLYPVRSRAVPRGNPESRRLRGWNMQDIRGRARARDGAYNQPCYSRLRGTLFRRPWQRLRRDLLPGGLSGFLTAGLG